MIKPEVGTYVIIQTAIQSVWICGQVIMHVSDEKDSVVVDGIIFMDKKNSISYVNMNYVALWKEITKEECEKNKSIMIEGYNSVIK